MNYTKKLLLICILMQVTTAFGQVVPNSWFEGWVSKSSDIPKNWSAFGGFSKTAGKTSGTSAIRLSNDLINGTVSYLSQANYDTASYFYLPTFAFKGTPDSVAITFRPKLGMDTTYFQLAFTKAGEPFPITFDEIQLFGNSGNWQTITFPVSQNDTSLHLVADSGWIFIKSADDIFGPYSSGFLDIDNIIFLNANKTNAPLIPNNSLENWDSYSVEQPLDWGTSYLFLKQAGIPVTNSSKTTDKHTGSYALKLQGAAIAMPGGITDTIPGLAITLKNATTATYNDIDLNSPAFKVTSRYQSIRGYLKSNLLAGDRASVFVNFFYKDTIVGSGIFNDTADHSSWFQFAEDIAWDSTFKGTPDSATIVLYVCDSNIIKVGSLNSWVIFDDLYFDNYNVHARKLTANSLRARLFPNPSNGNVTLKFQTTESATAVINITGLDGRIVKEINVDYHEGIQIVPIDLTSISKGIYFIQILTPEGIFTDKIVITP